MLHDIWHWLRGLDYGTVPAWAGAVSVIIGVLVFLRDRGSAARAQVNLIGIWCEANWDVALPGKEPRAQGGELTWHISNSSVLPIEVVHIAFDIHSKWFVPDKKQAEAVGVPVHSVEPGIRSTSMSLQGIRVAPQDTWVSPAQEIDLGYMAPDDASHLYLFRGGIECKIQWVLFVDNAGRRWEARPGAGKRIRRVRWFSRRRKAYPVEWQQPVLQTIRRIAARLRSTAKREVTRG